MKHFRSHDMIRAGSFLRDGVPAGLSSYAGCAELSRRAADARRISSRAFRAPAAAVFSCHSEQCEASFPGRETRISRSGRNDMNGPFTFSGNTVFFKALS